MSNRYRTCCNCWNIRAGTLVLGFLEFVSISIILSGIFRQLKWKNLEQSICSKKKWQDCLSFHHFNITLIGDYIIAIILLLVAICIILMFYGVITTKPRYLFPHLIIQAVVLLMSFGYFFLYVWSYLYGDLYIQKKKFLLEYFIERIWLSAIIFIFALCQCYLFFTVIKCSLYLNKLILEQKRRFMKFEEVSNRVRIAKENGLWRNTSWGGSFQQYRGQPEENKKTGKKTNFYRVQWNLDKNNCKANFTKKKKSNQNDVNNDDKNVKYSKDLLDVENTKITDLISNKNDLHSKQKNSFFCADSKSQKNNLNNKKKTSQKLNNLETENFISKDNTSFDDNKETKNLSTNALIYTKVLSYQKKIPKAVLKIPSNNNSIDTNVDPVKTNVDLNKTETNSFSSNTNINTFVKIKKKPTSNNKERPNSEKKKESNNEIKAKFFNTSL